MPLGEAGPAAPWHPAWRGGPTCGEAAELWLIAILWLDIGGRGAGIFTLLFKGGGGDEAGGGDAKGEVSPVDGVSVRPWVGTEWKLSLLVVNLPPQFNSCNHFNIKQ